MHESILPRVVATITTKKEWDTLGTAYQGLDKVKTSKLQILRRDFESLSMKDSKSINSFYTKVFDKSTKILWRNHNRPKGG